jgi:hypothetical protein
MLMLIKFISLPLCVSHDFISLTSLDEIIMNKIILLRIDEREKFEGDSKDCNLFALLFVPFLAA